MPIWRRWARRASRVGGEMEAPQMGHSRVSEVSPGAGESESESMTRAVSSERPWERSKSTLVVVGSDGGRWYPKAEVGRDGPACGTPV